MQQHIEETMAAQFLRIQKATEAQAGNAIDEGSNEKDNEQEPPQHVYHIGKAFLPQDSSYWVENLRTARFSSSLPTGILYGPKIVDDLNAKVREVLERPLATGIMLKGPQGVGKSHSLEMKKWTALSSKSFISCVDGVLQSMSKQWVLVFDQINRLFSRPKFMACTDVGVLGFPFNWIKYGMKPGRTASIISASVNNGKAYKERHEGFEEFEHETQMTDGEIIDIYSLKDQPRLSAESQVEEIDKLTGRVPLYVREYLNFGGSVEQYESQIEGSVLDSLIALSRRDALTSLKTVPIRIAHVETVGGDRSNPGICISLSCTVLSSRGTDFVRGSLHYAVA